MRIFFLIIGLFLPQAAFGRSVENLAPGAAGISNMWNMATTVLPFRGQGGNAIVNISGNMQSYGIIVVTIINGVLWLSGGCAVIMMIWGGIQMITSGLNEEQLGKGKKTIMYALSGLIFVLLAEVIVWFVGGFAYTLGDPAIITIP